MAHVAVFLSGAGHRDGAELREACYTLLALDQADATFDCYAPDMPQAVVVNHLTGEPMRETRNVLVEAARIARGDIRPAAEFSADNYDALLFPGGFGGALNFSNFAQRGANGTVHPEVASAIAAMHAASKPLGFICITPACLGALALGKHGVKLTIGNDEATAAAIADAGAVHVPCATDDALVDETHRIASTPAYMDGQARPAQVYAGIKKCVDATLGMIQVPHAA